jgi:DDE superfamily endonuclease
MLPFMSKRLSSTRTLQSHPSLIFQHDNAPIHTAKKVKSWIQAKGITVMDWPAQSPDINPMENLWSVLKQNVQKTGPKNLQELRDSIEKEWSLIGHNYLWTLIKSMPERMKRIIEAHGRSIKY